MNSKKYPDSLNILGGVQKWVQQLILSSPNIGPLKPVILFIYKTTLLKSKGLTGTEQKRILQF